MGCTMQKCVFEHMRTAKAQISLYIRAVRSGPLLFTNRIIDTIECFNEERMIGWDFVHMQDDVNLHILRMYHENMTI